MKTTAAAAKPMTTKAWGKLPSRYVAMQRALLPRLVFEMTISEGLGRVGGGGGDDIVSKRYNSVALGFQKTSKDEYQSSAISMGRSLSGSAGCSVEIQSAGALAPRWEDCDWSLTLLIDAGNGWSVVGKLAYPAHPKIDLSRFEGTTVRLGYKLHVRPDDVDGTAEDLTAIRATALELSDSKNAVPLSARLSLSNLAFDLTWFYPCPSARERSENELMPPCHHRRPTVDVVMGPGPEGPILVSAIRLRFANAEPGRGVRILLRNYGENEHTSFSWHREAVQDARGRVVFEHIDEAARMLRIEFADVGKNPSGPSAGDPKVTFHLSELAIIGGLCWGQTLLSSFARGFAFHGPKRLFARLRTDRAGRHPLPSLLRREWPSSKGGPVNRKFRLPYRCGGAMDYRHIRCANTPNT
mgnify:CR=1 FL=1